MRHKQFVADALTLLPVGRMNRLHKKHDAFKKNKIFLFFCSKDLYSQVCIAVFIEIEMFI